tara:strand:+ start:3991 stop:5010 length:1020 start_codon:yes stop_codon:yes gene_type:complete
MIRYSICIFFISLLHTNCSLPKAPYQSIKGKTMGTTYSIIYQGRDDIKGDVDVLLKDINSEVSTYITSATISQYNESETVFVIDTGKQHFVKNWNASKIVYKETEGFFDPSVMPLINYWGFGYTEKKARSEIDSTAVEKMMKGVGLDKIIDSESFLYKPIPSAQLDFSAIAKGYAVDALAESLEEKGCKNYLVEVGREVYAKGLNVSGQKWKVGISTPSSEAAIDDISRVVELTDSGVASSGNYRNFYIVDGKKYGHTIDPHTGYPSLNDLLGTTVISKSCMRSDAYATAFLAMGLERASILVEELDEVEACFFYSNQEGTIIKKYSNGFIQYVAGSEK